MDVLWWKPTPNRGWLNFNPYIPPKTTMDTLQATNISPKNDILKMIFLFPRWDMLIPWRVPKNDHMLEKVVTPFFLRKYHRYIWDQSQRNFWDVKFSSPPFCGGQKGPLIKWQKMTQNLPKVWQLLSSASRFRISQTFGFATLYSGDFLLWPKFKWSTLPETQENASWK